MPVNLTRKMVVMQDPVVTHDQYISGLYGEILSNRDAVIGRTRKYEEESQSPFHTTSRCQDIGGTSYES